MKRTLILVLVGLLMIVQVSPAAARVDVRLTEAIRLAKSFFPETDTYREFNSRVMTTEEQELFILQWSGSTADPARHNPSQIWVSVDLNRRLVINYRHEPATPRGQGTAMTAIPQHGRERAEQIAIQFANRLAPTQFAAMRLVSVDEPAIRIGRRFWPHFYSFNYVRYVNNIPFPQNSMRVTVNADTGVVQEYNLVWGDYSFPAPQNLISQNQLAAIFGEVGFELMYRRVQWWRPMQNEESEPFLAFVFRDGASLMIDAVTGKVSQAQWQTPFPPGRDLTAGEGAKTEEGLTAAELKEIEFVAGLIPLERAESIAREVAQLPSTVGLVNSGLFARGDSQERIWQLTFGTRGEGSVWAHVTLDAATGALLNFSYSDDEKQPVAPRLELEDAQRLAEAFLVRWAGDKFARVRLVSEPVERVGDELPHSYWFSYQRYENGIPVENDQIYVGVRHDQRVTSFGFNWYEGKFPSPTGVLTADQMNALFLREHGLYLEYVLETTEEGERNPARSVVRLVYRPKRLSSYSFNAFTGKNIDHAGEEIVPPTKPAYTDIAGHWAERDIRQLVDLGLLRLEGPQLKPDAVITVGEFLRLLSDASGFTGSAVIEARSFAAQSGIMNDQEAEDVDLEQQLTRQLMAFYLARHQGHAQTAALRGIWSAPFADFGAVAPEYQGSVAVVHALGLMRGDTNRNFLPQQLTTRAQAIAIIARMLHLQ